MDLVNSSIIPSCPATNLALLSSERDRCIIPFFFFDNYVRFSYQTQKEQQQKVCVACEKHSLLFVFADDSLSVLRTVTMTHICFLNNLLSFDNSSLISQNIHSTTNNLNLRVLRASRF